MSVLAVDVEKVLGAFTLAAQFEAAGGATALYGPSGAENHAGQHDRRSGYA